MVETPGICAQTTTCDAARSGRLMTVPLGSPFVCSDCGHALVPPVQATKPDPAQRTAAAVPLALIGAGLLVLGGAVFLGHELGQVTVAPLSQAPGEGPRARPPAALAPATPARLAAAVPAPAPSITPPLPASQAAAPRPDPVALASKPAGTRPATPAVSATPPPASAPPVALPATITLASAVLSHTVSTQVAALSPLIPKDAVSVAPPPPAVADQGFSPVPVVGGTPAYPAELAADGSTGRVGVTCQVSADGTPSGCHAVASRGGPAFAAATLAWLAHAHVRFRPVILQGRPVAGAHSWTISIDEAPSALAEAKRRRQEAAKAEAGQADLAAEPSPPASASGPTVTLPVQPIIARQVVAPRSRPVADRPFSSRVVAGGVPAFPSTYDDGRPGAVTVQCTIEEDGAPTLCHILKAVGGSAFGKSVQSWLISGRVRFHPVIAGGQAVASEESWTVVFNSVPARSAR